jgi:hypothetical protein
MTVDGNWLQVFYGFPDVVQQARLFLFFRLFTFAIPFACLLMLHVLFF